MSRNNVARHRRPGRSAPGASGLTNTCASTTCSGTLEYLKLFRLTRAQYRRYHLLSTLARHQWNFLEAASQLGVEGREGVARSLVESDLGYLLNPGLYGHLMTWLSATAAPTQLPLEAPISLSPAR